MNTTVSFLMQVRRYFSSPEKNNLKSFFGSQRSISSVLILTFAPVSVKKKSQNWNLKKKKKTRKKIFFGKFALSSIHGVVSVARVRKISASIVVGACFHPFGFDFSRSRGRFSPELSWVLRTLFNRTFSIY